MPIGEGSIIQAKLFGQLGVVETLNVQYYIILDMSSIADDLADYAQPMYNHWTENLSVVVSTQMAYTRMELYEVNGLDFGIYADPTPVVGELTGEILPPFVGVSVQQVRQSRATRHGWKRFAGLTEAQQSGGTLISTALSSWQSQIATLFPVNLTLQSQEFPATREITFQPIIWGGNDPDFPLGRYSAIANYVVKPNVTSQVTRKIGRGD